MTDDVSFRLAYDEAVRALDAQAETLNGIRQRAGTVLATTMVVTAFFGGQAVASGAEPSSAGWLAVAAFVVAGVLSVSVLFPTDPTFSTDIGAVIALVERASSEREPLRELALALSGQHGANQDASRACSGSSAPGRSRCSSRSSSGSSFWPRAFPSEPRRHPA